MSEDDFPLPPQSEEFGAQAMDLVRVRPVLHDRRQLIVLPRDFRFDSYDVNVLRRTGGQLFIRSGHREPYPPSPDYVPLIDYAGEQAITLPKGCEFDTFDVIIRRSRAGEFTIDAGCRKPRPSVGEMQAIWARIDGLQRSIDEIEAGPPREGGQ